MHLFKQNPTFPYPHNKHPKPQAMYPSAAQIGKKLNQLIPRDQTVLVAVSGGADSVALLHMLHTAGYACVVAHCNFHLRGNESNRDEDFVRNICQTWGISLLVKDLSQTQSYAQTNGLSIEMAARELRYNWFANLLTHGTPEGQPLHCLALAHHADDDAETFLLNLTRGTGLRGLTGMKDEHHRMVRPLLDLSRADIEAYCQHHGLSYVTDSTNLTDDYTRNRLRHRVIPELKSINPSFLRTMRANERRLEGVYAVFLEQYETLMRQRVTSIPNTDPTKESFALAMPLLTQQAATEPFLHEMLSPRGFSSADIENIARCIARQRWGRIFLSPNGRVVVDRANLIVEYREGCTKNEGNPMNSESPKGKVIGQTASAHAIKIERKEITECQALEMADPIGLRLSLIEVDESYRLSRSNERMHLDADQLTFPLTLRHWNHGDVFCPIGMRGQKKLSDFFVDIKLSIAQKEQTWVLEQADGTLACVVGLRPDDRAKVTTSTKHVLEIRKL